MTEIELHVIQWVLGIFGACAVFLFGVWWKIESRQDHKIDQLQADNDKAHGLLHKKIGDTKTELKDEMTGQHLAIRDKIEVLIREVRNGNGR